MNNEERDLISKFVARVGGQGQGGFGSVPNTQPALPAIDPEADQFIGQQFQQYPEARYRITQMAVVQEAALVQAQNRIQQLQFQLQQAQQALQQAQQQSSQPSSGGGFLGGLFGGGRGAQQQQQPQGAPPPGWGGSRPAGGAPQYQAAPPQYQQMPYGMQPGMFQRSGTGFLGSALTTATGVAGGMLAANALTSLFSGHHDAGGAGFGAGVPQSETINNYYGDNSDPFAGNGTAADSNFDVGPADDGGWDAGGGDDFGGGDWGDSSF
ncbi:DUF2076 domain-containing protein [Acetobacter thailandicus]|uniref:DUF2076 domain-containing protein n=1 Tax=Acetobacter thailandicus TaxID=1502842 RepID=UPI001BAAB57B|nr:DUF2076 domain-containing protein [Acetobacter thailandicus]MBS1004176.1 DUF2076 domain-containing protein [Acetobacter thailandicus]